MKVICFVSLLFLSLHLFAQKLEYWVGLNTNHFYDFHQNSPHFSASYKNGSGFTTGYGIDSVVISWMTFRFTLQYDNYQGKIDYMDGGLGSGFTIHASVNKSVITAGIFPVNFSFLKNFSGNLGFMISEIVHDGFSGVQNGWSISKKTWSYSLESLYSKISTNTCLGIQGRLAYHISIGKSLKLVPQYNFYLGLSDEFTNQLMNIRSNRHYFLMGLNYQFPTKKRQ